MERLTDVGVGLAVHVDRDVGQAREARHLGDERLQPLGRREELDVRLLVDVAPGAAPPYAHRLKAGFVLFTEIGFGGRHKRCPKVSVENPFPRHSLAAQAATPCSRSKHAILHLIQRS